MAKVPLDETMKEQAEQPDEAPLEAGPFITVSRAFGCYGFSLGLLLMEILNDDADPEHTWKIYHREILERLATETNTAADLLQQQRRAKPRLLTDFFRSLSGKESLPSGYEVRRKITEIIRALAIQGHAIVIGEGGSAAAHDLPDGISIRLEAPEDWRVREVAFREGLSHTKAKLRILEVQRERDYLRKLYSSRFHSKPSFALVYDCSTFTLAQIAQHVVYAMKLKGII